MTFEEFILKKKIDLAQFESAEPGLFSEFQSHYSQMGEKSFDHSKKFLFNKLRRTFHLKEDPKPAIVQEPVKENKLAAQAEPLLSPTIAATVYTPRFRAPGKANIEPETPKPDAEQAKKPAYTPRFKAQPAKNTEAPLENNTRLEASSLQTSDLQSPTSDSAPAEKPKQAYIPRFKAPIPKPAQDTKDDDSPNNP